MAPRKRACPEGTAPPGPKRKTGTGKVPASGRSVGRATPQTVVPGVAMPIRGADSSVPMPAWGKSGASHPGQLPDPKVVVANDDLYNLMNKIGTSVLGRLPDALSESQRANPILAAMPLPAHLHECQPLQLGKAAWNKDEAAKSLLQSGMYEASGNLLWLSPYPLTLMDQVIAGEPPTWARIWQVSQTVMSLKADQGPSLASAQGPVTRLMFPIVVPAHLSEIDSVRLDFQHSLRVVAGHEYILGWYLAMFLALEDTDLSCVVALWQMALTTSIHIRHGLDVDQLAIWSIKNSESMRSVSATHHDPFHAFSLKCLQILKPNLGNEKMSDQKASELLKQAGVTFRGQPVSRACSQGIMLFKGTLDASAINWLRRISAVEVEGANDIFDSGYTKLVRLTGLCRTAADTWKLNLQQTVCFVLSALWYSLRKGILKAAECTEAGLYKSRSGELGWGAIFLCRRGLLQHLYRVVLDGRPDSPETKNLKADMDLLWPHLEDYGKLQDAFPPGDVSETPHVRFTEALSTGIGGGLVDMCYAVLHGALDNSFRDLLETSKGLEHLQFSGLKNPKLEAFLLACGPPPGVGETHCGEAPSCPQRGGGETHHCGEAPMSTGDDSQRELQSGTGKELQNKDSILSYAADQRKKYVNFCSPSSWNQAEIQRVCDAEDAAPVMRRQTTGGTANRLILFSSDLLHEGQKTPWQKLPEWSKAHGVALRWALEQKGEGDIVVLCDGRSKECRSKLEAETRSMKHGCELVVIFVPSPRAGRRVTFGSDNIEMMTCILPVARTAIAVKQRSGGFGQGAGEKTTHDASYTGVQSLPWKAMSMVAPDIKRKILGNSQVESPRCTLFDSHLGQPLFWAERKPVQLWKSLFQDLSATCIVDLSPGSGVAARAAMQLGLPYFGIARNSAHANWLNNVLDRDALLHICTHDNIMFMQDLGRVIEEHFKDLVGDLRRRDAAEDAPPQDDDDDCTA